MLQHDITNNKYYSDGVEISAEEYAVEYQKWKEEHPLPPPIPPEQETPTDEEIANTLEGVL